jgi:hypothetical protein
MISCEGQLISEQGSAVKLTGLQSSTHRAVGVEGDLK